MVANASRVRSLEFLLQQLTKYKISLRSIICLCLNCCFVLPSLLRSPTFLTRSFAKLSAYVPSENACISSLDSGLQTLPNFNLRKETGVERG